MSTATDLIPHRPPFVWVDRVLFRTEGQIEAEKHLTAGDPMPEGRLPDPFIIEALAQTCALSVADAKGSHQGMLVQVSKFEFHARAHVGDTVRLLAKRSVGMGALQRFEVEAHVDGNLLGRGELTFAVQA